MAVEKMKKGKNKFERKRKSYKLCRGKINVTEELKIVRLVLEIKILYVGISAYMC